jgi:fumarate reductase subunit C
MNGTSGYREFHPRWIRPRMSTYWWLGSRPYFAFILRELSSLFVAWFVVYLLLLVRALGRGPAEYEAFLTWSAHPPVLALNVVTFFFIVFHAVTWFNLAPKAMVVRVGGTRVPGLAIAAGNYAAWAAVSAVIVWLLLR